MPTRSTMPSRVFKTSYGALQLNTDKAIAPKAAALKAGTKFVFQASATNL